MKYVSEITQKAYDTEIECLEAEKAYQETQAKAIAEKEKLAAKRTKKAKKVEEAYKQVVEANRAYKKELDEFIEKYGSFHMTYTSTPEVIDGMFNSIFKFF